MNWNFIKLFFIKLGLIYWHEILLKKERFEMTFTNWNEIAWNTFDLKNTVKIKYVQMTLK